MVIEYGFDTLPKYKYLDELLMKLTKKDLNDFYKNCIQPKFEHHNEVHGETYHLDSVYIGSRTYNGGTHFDIVFEDKSNWNQSSSITFSLFGHVGIFGTKFDQLAEEWVDFLINKLGFEYQKLAAHHFKRKLYDKQVSLDNKKLELKRNQSYLDNEFVELYKKFGDAVDVVTGDLFDNIG